MVRDSKACLFVPRSFIRAPSSYDILFQVLGTVYSLSPDSRTPSQNDLEVISRQTINIILHRRCDAPTISFLDIPATCVCVCVCMCIY